MKRALSHHCARPSTKEVLGWVPFTYFGAIPKFAAKLCAAITYREEESFCPF